MDKKEILRKINLYADLLEFHGGNPFKIRAFRNSVNLLRRLEGNIEEMVKTGSLLNIKGIGKGIASFLNDLILTGDSPELSNLLDKTPTGILDILSVRGLGAKKVSLLFNELGIDNLDSLEKACRENKLAGLKGFGEKTQNKILEEIKNIKASKKLLLLPQAENIAYEIVQILNKINSVKKVEITGELRRVREIIGEINILILTTSFEEFKKEANDFFVLREFKVKDYFTTTQVEYPAFDKVMFTVVNEESDFKKALLHTTGSAPFLEKLGAEKDDDEESVFKKKGISFIPPEMREEEYFNLPEKLRTPSNLDFEDIKGMLHFHTVFSDGINSLAEMLEAASSLGFTYAAVCDHSKSAYYANGLTGKRISEQKELIENLRKTSGIKILQGIESDILKDGSLDYDDEVLKQLDFIVASVHSNFGMTEEEMTNRIIRAVENPFTDVLGHPTGRLLLRREGYKVNIRKIIDACADNSVAIEINANPYRLDLDWRNIYYARKKGCLLAINADAHSTGDILYTHYGIKIARKAGTQKSEVINFFEYEKFVKFLNRKVTRNVD